MVGHWERWFGFGQSRFRIWLGGGVLGLLIPTIVLLLFILFGITMNPMIFPKSHCIAWPCSLVVDHGLDREFGVYLSQHDLADRRAIDGHLKL
jgi:hypothetical protein